MPRTKGKTARKRSSGNSKTKNLKVVKGGKSSKKFDEDTFYKKYKHVVPGSVKEVKPGTVVDGVKAVHGRVCKIKCQESGKLRTINVQDAFQVKFSVEVQKKKMLERAAARRNRKRKASKKKAS